MASRKVSLNADEMGLGKTIQAIGMANKLKARKILILCPAIAKINWMRELRVWYYRPDATIHIVNKRNEKIPPADIIIVNYDLIISKDIQCQLNARRFALGVVDEAHYLKNLDAQRTKAVLAPLKSPAKRGVIQNCVYKTFLTGTPILNRPVELFPLLFTCAKHVIEPFDSYERYVLQWCGGYYTDFGLEDRGASNLDDLNSRLKSTIMIRRKEKQVESQLPPRRIKILEIEPDPGVKVDDPKSLEEGEELSLGEYSTLRRQTALAKEKQIIKYVQEKLTERDKIVVFAYHRELVEILIEKFKGDNYYYRRFVYGGMSNQRKQEAMDTFQNDPRCKIFIANIQSVGVAISLTAANYALFAESSWVPGEISQCIKRLHRHGQKEHTFFEFMVIKDSIEKQMLQSALTKAEIIRKAIDGK